MITLAEAPDFNEVAEPALITVKICPSCETRFEEDSPGWRYHQILAKTVAEDFREQLQKAIPFIGRMILINYASGDYSFLEAPSRHMLFGSKTVKIVGVRVNTLQPCMWGRPMLRFVTNDLIPISKGSHLDFSDEALTLYNFRRCKDDVIFFQPCGRDNSYLEKEMALHLDPIK